MLYMSTTLVWIYNKNAFLKSSFITTCNSENIEFGVRVKENISSGIGLMERGDYYEE